MIFAAINWIDISINLLLVVFVIVCLFMSLLILMQRPKQEGLGAAFGGGVTDQVFGARTTNVLQKGTVYLGSLFFLLSLTLAILIGKQSEQKTLLEPVSDQSEAAIVEEEEKEEPVAESIADQLPDEETVETEVMPAPPASIPANDLAEEAADAVLGDEEAEVEAPVADEVEVEQPIAQPELGPNEEIDLSDEVDGAVEVETEAEPEEVDQTE